MMFDLNAMERQTAAEALRIGGSAFIRHVEIFTRRVSGFKSEFARSEKNELLGTILVIL